MAHINAYVRAYIVGIQTLLSLLPLLLIVSRCGDQAATGRNESRENADAVECGELDAVDAYVSAYQQMAAFDGVVLIAEMDQIVYHCGYGYADYRFKTPLDRDAKFRIASLSKQFTQALIGRMVDDGLATLDAPLADFLPDFPDGDRITLGQLVEHTSGVAHTNRLAWLDMRRMFSLDEIVARLSDEPLLFEPGSDNAYSNGGYALLAAVIEQVSNASFQHVVTTEITDEGYPSVGHESPFQVVPGLVSRYAPGPTYGERVEAPPYIVANKIGGGSLFANAVDLWRFFRATYGGFLLSDATTAALFAKPSDGDVLITGRAPGALAQIYLNFNTGLSVVTLSSNSGWPGSFNADIASLYRGEEASLTPFTIDPTPFTEASAAPYVGSFQAERFGWQVQIERWGAGLVFVQDDVQTAFARTKDGAFHLPIYDWLCDYTQDGTGFTCRQRDPDAEIRFVFGRSR